MIIRIAASWIQPLQVISVPRGARTTRDVPPAPCSWTFTSSIDAPPFRGLDPAPSILVPAGGGPEPLPRLRDQPIPRLDSVERDPDGTAHVKNEISGTTETATAIGALVGGLVTFVFPLAGIALGAALGALVGRMLDRGVSDTFVDEVKGTLRPGRSALFLVVKASNADATLAALRQYRGDVIQTTLDSEAEEALRQALD